MRKRNDNTLLIILVIIGLALRVLCACLFYGHPTDMSCFNAWSDLMRNVGPSGFYSSDSFTDYPPLYMYILWLIGFIKSIAPMSETAVGVLLKAPAMIADIITAVLLYKIAPKSKNSAAAFWLFNPAVILNSSIWGQVDAVFTLAVLVSLYMLMRKRLVSSYFTFAIAVMIKPQALFYTPIILFATADAAIFPTFNGKLLIKYILSGLSAIVFAFTLCVPFGIENVVSQYIGTLSSYSYCSVNAYNFWTALGLNWTALKPCYTILSNAAIVTAVILSGVFYFRLKGDSKIFLLSGFICLFVFTFAAKMHERYAFPVMLLLYIAYTLNRDERILNCSLIVTALQFINCGLVLFFDSILSVVIGIFTVALTLYLVFIIVKQCNFKVNKISFQTRKITKKDWQIIAVLTAVYSVVAFTNLGDTKSPQSGVTLENSSQSFSLSENEGISGFMLYLGEYHLEEDNSLTIELLSGDDSIYETELTEGSVFAWEEYAVELGAADTLTLAADGRVRVLEAAVLNQSGENIGGYGAIFDEEKLVPNRRTYRNSTYFDEIYHARTAYELLEGEDIYEWTHPPLGKILIGVGIRLFGMTPFGWRFTGTLFGVLMVAVLYIFSKKLFGNTAAAAFSTVLFTFDFMHFVQTRIATIDVYVTFFIMLQYLFMFLWLESENYKKGLLWLFLSGLSFGLSAASKWTGIYAGVGLAVIFFAKLIFSKNNVKKHILFAIGAFVIVPVAVYLLSYIPFIRAEGGGLYAVWQNQVDMLSYHGGIDATHPYSSRWYQWAVMTRPVWYYSGGSGEGISAFGNPLVWWIGIPTFFYTVYYWLVKRDKTAAFLAVGYLAQLVPWVAVTRITFIYHYFPALPFSVLMTTFAFSKLCSRRTMIVYAAAAVGLFLLFYPVLSGGYISPDFVENFLRWSENWVLVGG